MMKKNLFLLAAMAIVAFASCTSDGIAGSPTDISTEEGVSPAIVFSGGSSAITRASLYGSDAASKLGGKFVVYGTKHSTAEDMAAGNDLVVFNNFQVEYAASSAGLTGSNSSDWEYVGKQAYDATPTSQGIKYWDYSATAGHTFYAFSSPDITYPQDATNDKVVVTKVTADETSLYNKGYQVTVKTDADLQKLYFSDRLPVAVSAYDKTVTFNFRNLASMVRFGFYETIPGYTVKIDRVYVDDDADAPVTTFAAMKDSKSDGFYASLQHVKRTADQTLNVTYYDNTDATIENTPKVSNPAAGYDYTLKIGDGTGLFNTELGTTSSAPTWAVAGGAYTTVYPFDGNTNPLLLKLDFTMTAEDGSNDVIRVRGARAIIPAEYVKWKGNSAYTYIFKISDKTNGTTGAVDENGDPTDPEGLKPITFNAVTVDVTEEKQETISSVSTNSITTYAQGAIADEYTADSPIYTVISNASTGAVITPTALGDAAGEAQVYKLNKAATEAEVFAQLTGSPMGITMTAETTTRETTVPLVGGSTATISNVKFTPSAAATYYAYVYTTTAYVAPTYEVQTSGTYDSSATYYMQSGSGAYFAVPVTNATSFDANKTKLYLQTAAGTPGVYDIKIIKVQ